jgi:HPt (histidine-containing phosphotransfer) domain-containing protein
MPSALGPARRTDDLRRGRTAPPVAWLARGRRCRMLCRSTPAASTEVDAAGVQLLWRWPEPCRAAPQRLRLQGPSPALPRRLRALGLLTGLARRPARGSRSMNQTERDNSFIAEALPAFISEAQEQIASIEQLLLQLEDAPDDRDLLDALFRCAHTVKGSAGIFGLDRGGGLHPPCRDAARPAARRRDRADARPGHAAAAAATTRSALLVARPGRWQADDAQGEATRAALVRGCGAQAPPDAAHARHARRPPRRRRTASQCWHRGAIRRRHLPQRHGPAGDPELRGAAGHMTASSATRRGACAGRARPRDLPPRLRLQLDTDTSRAAIEAAFSFVRDDCQLYVMEPARRRTCG